MDYAGMKGERNDMQKWMAMLLTLVFCIALAGCGAQANSDTQGDTSASVEEPAENTFGITLTAEEVSPTGATLLCVQSGGEEVVELNTGSFYTLQQKVDGAWVDVPMLPQEYEIAWTDEAYLIALDSTTELTVNWEWLYGELPAGEYRVGKGFMNFRGPGDYDTETVYAEFVIG